MVFSVFTVPAGRDGHKAGCVTEHGTPGSQGPGRGLARESGAVFYG